MQCWQPFVGAKAPQRPYEVFALVLQQGSLRATFPSPHRLDAALHV